VEQIVVAGNQYCSEEEIIEWLKQDPYSDNTLYLLWKYNQNDVEQLPAVEEAKVGLKDLRTVTVQVKEKTFSGRIMRESFCILTSREKPPWSQIP
jgi:cell division protein FtsQ